MITEILSLRHFKTLFCCLKTDFNKRVRCKALPEWVKVSKKRFDTIKNKVQNAKNNNLQARPLGNPINFTKSSKFIQVMANVKITSEEALKKNNQHP